MTSDIESGRRLAHGAAASAAVFAAVSLYWALGGSAGVRTVGGFAQHMDRSGNGGLTALLWATAAIKAGGALVALSLVRPWGAALPRRGRIAVAGGASVILTLYGAINMVGEALVETGVIRPAGGVDWTALRWHLALWDPWFLVWGMLLAGATREFARRPVLNSRPTAKCCPPPARSSGYRPPDPRRAER